MLRASGKTLRFDSRLWHGLLILSRALLEREGAEFPQGWTRGPKDYSGAELLLLAHSFRMLLKNAENVWVPRVDMLTGNVGHAWTHRVTTLPFWKWPYERIMLKPTGPVLSVDPPTEQIKFWFYHIPSKPMISLRGENDAVCANPSWKDARDILVWLGSEVTEGPVREARPVWANIAWPKVIEELNTVLPAIDRAFAEQQMVKIDWEPFEGWSLIRERKAVRVDG